MDASSVGLRRRRLDGGTAGARVRFSGTTEQVDVAADAGSGSEGPHDSDTQDIDISPEGLAALQVRLSELDALIANLASTELLPGVRVSDEGPADVPPPVVIGDRRIRRFPVSVPAAQLQPVDDDDDDDGSGDDDPVGAGPAVGGQAKGVSSPRDGEDSDVTDDDDDDDDDIGGDGGAASRSGVPAAAMSPAEEQLMLERIRMANLDPRAKVTVQFCWAHPAGALIVSQ
jgi:hypothetical protein